jgi:hypothetical protein
MADDLGPLVHRRHAHLPPVLGPGQATALAADRPRIRHGSDVEVLGEPVGGAFPAGPDRVEAAVVGEDGHVDGPHVVERVADRPLLPIGAQRMVGLQDVGAVVRHPAVAGRVVDVPASPDLVQLGRPDLAVAVRPVRRPDDRLGIAVHPREILEALDDDAPVSA